MNAANAALMLPLVSPPTPPQTSPLTSRMALGIAVGLLAAAPLVLWTEVLVQGLIAGAGTLFTYAKMVSLLGPSRAAIFPALAPGLAALLAWPVLDHVPTVAETTGLVTVMAGLVLAVTGGLRR